MLILEKLKFSLKFNSSCCIQCNISVRYLDTTCREALIPDDIPAEVIILFSSTNLTSLITVILGYSVSRREISIQCVVPLSPSNNPASAKMNAPVQIENVIFVVWCFNLIQFNRCALYNSTVSAPYPPGITRISMHGQFSKS